LKGTANFTWNLKSQSNRNCRYKSNLLSDCHELFHKHVFSNRHILVPRKNTNYFYAVRISILLAILSETSFKLVTFFRSYARKQ